MSCRQHPSVSSVRSLLRISAGSRKGAPKDSKGRQSPFLQRHWFLPIEPGPDKPVRFSGAGMLGEGIIHLRPVLGQSRERPHPFMEPHGDHQSRAKNMIEEARHFSQRETMAHGKAVGSTNE